MTRNENNLWKLRKSILNVLNQFVTLVNCILMCDSGIFICLCDEPMKITWFRRVINALQNNIYFNI